MRTIIASVVAAFLVAGSLRSQESQSQAEATLTVPIGFTTDSSIFERKWGMKLKSMSLVYYKKEGEKTIEKDGWTKVVKTVETHGRISYLFEFETSLPFYDLDILQRTLSAENKKIRHLFFNDENVALNAGVQRGHTVFGAVSGIQGEAIRVTYDLGKDPEIMIRNAKKLVVRPE